MLTRTEITAKLEKLLALAAGSANENEAANAFARAQKLASDYRIELAEISASGEPANADDEMTEDAIVIDGKRIMGWKKILISKICEANGVFVFQSREHNFNLAGRQGDVRATIYMFAAISAEVERLGSRQYGMGRKWVNAYKLGAALTVGNRIVAQSQQDIKAARDAGSVSSAALVKIETSALVAQRWYENKRRAAGENVRWSSAGSTKYSSRDAFAAGQQAGSKINIGGNAALAAGRKMLGA